MAFLISSIQFFFGLPRALFSNIFVKEENFPQFQQYYFVFSLYRSNGFIMALLACAEWRFLKPYQGLYFMFPLAKFFPLF